MPRETQLEDLIRHMAKHIAYPQHGYLWMSTQQKVLYCELLGAEFTPTEPIWLEETIYG
jgi:hypothetical protein